MKKQTLLSNTLLSDKTNLVHLIDKLLIDLLKETKHLKKRNSVFDCKQVPVISVHEYLRRICKYARCSECVFVAALIYIDRYQERIQNFIINSFNVHRLLITCIMVGAKFFDDFYYKNEFYAKIGGISKADINVLELELLQTFEFNIFISTLLAWKPIGKSKTEKIVFILTIFIYHSYKVTPRPQLYLSNHENRLLEMNSAFEIKVILNMQANKRANHILSFTQNKQLSPGCPKLPPIHITPALNEAGTVGNSFSQRFLLETYAYDSERSSLQQKDRSDKLSLNSSNVDYKNRSITFFYTDSYPSIARYHGCDSKGFDRKLSRRHFPGLQKGCRILPVQPKQSRFPVIYTQGKSPHSLYIFEERRSKPKRQLEVTLSKKSRKNSDDATPTDGIRLVNSASLIRQPRGNRVSFKYFSPTRQKIQRQSKVLSSNIYLAQSQFMSRSEIGSSLPGSIESHSYPELGLTPQIVPPQGLQCATGHSMDRRSPYQPKKEDYELMQSIISELGLHFDYYPSN